MQLNFDARTVTPDTGIAEAIPAGWYNVMIDQSEIKPTKQGDGRYLEIRFNVLDGQYANRKVFTRLNIMNPNPTAQEIGQKQLSAVCHALGVLVVQDSQQLHGIPMKIRVKVRAADGEYEASNEITAYKNINEQVGQGASAPAAPQGFQPAPAAPAAPQGWAQPVAPQQAPAQPQFQQPAAPAAAPQPWQQAPAAAPQVPAVAPAPQAPAQPWQAPAAQQPWAAAPAPVAAPQAPAAPSAAVQQAQQAIPAWAQQPQG